MKHVITAITAAFAFPKSDEDALNLPIIPGTATLSRSTASDGLTEEITVNARLKEVPADCTADLSMVSVAYLDDQAGTQKTLTFGSSDIPARFTLEDNVTIAVKCTYRRVL